MFSFRCLIPIIVLVAGTTDTAAQCKTVKEFNSDFEALQNADEATFQKLGRLLKLKSDYELCLQSRDSVYAKILHKIGVFDYLVNNNKPTERAIMYTRKAAAINTSGLPGAQLSLAALNFNNLARFYDVLGEHKISMAYYDSAIIVAKQFPAFQQLMLVARHEKTNFLFTSGDYDKCIEESTLGETEAEQVKDTLWMISFINQRAQSFYFQDLYDKAAEDAHRTIMIGQDLKTVAKKTEKLAGIGVYDYEMASAYKLSALTIQDSMELPRFDKLLDSAAFLRKRSGDEGALCDDLLDYGSYYLLKAHDNKKAKMCFQRSFEYAGDYGIRWAYAYLNLGSIAEREGRFGEAEKKYLKTFQLLNLPSTSIEDNFSFYQVNMNSEKNLLHDLLVYKTEYLLSAYKRTENSRYLKACVQNAMLTDSLIKSMRREQSSEKSKLFWRKQTRQFFTDALEACYLAKNYPLAFYFMENSRAVILSDKLAELGASSLLPLSEAMKEKQFTDQIVSYQRQLNDTKPGSALYHQTEIRLLETNQDFERFVRSLEKKYPAYYQYKYDDSVATLDQLHQYLADKKENFVYYFTGDSVIYVLGISPDKITMIKVLNKEFRTEEVRTFLNMFADKQAVNNHYSNFIAVSYDFYRKLFQPLQLAKGKVIVCSDEFFIPFEALYTDGQGKHLLINDFAVSYVFSAGYLFKAFPGYPAKGNFVGFAPVSFNPALGVTDLTNSAMSLNLVAANYASPLVYENKASSRNKFLSAIGQYDVVNVFSHASAETGLKEPMLFMQDSMIRLSELQSLSRPATKLVVLSACQTTAGRSATGEGIYSLARGFASAGIPSIAATLWKADEKAIYEISELFHEYLSRGLPKDEALQHAKLAFLKNADRETSLPYYWANMVVIGKVDPLAPKKRSANYWWIAGAGLLAISVVVFVVVSRRLALSSRTTKLVS